MGLEKIFEDEYNAYSEIKHIVGTEIVTESMPCMNKEKFTEVVEKLLIQRVSKAERTVCPDCGDYGRIYSEDGTTWTTCPCHY